MYPNSKLRYTKFATMLELLQMKEKHMWSDRSVTTFLTFLQDLLPEGNNMPQTTYKAQWIICPLGMEVERIHACTHDCMLYRGEDKSSLHECSVCKAPRYKAWKDDDISDDSDDDDMETE